MNVMCIKQNMELAVLANLKEIICFIQSFTFLPQYTKNHILVILRSDFQVLIDSEYTL